jgi:two-component system, NarL family, response regulator LiaR
MLSSQKQNTWASVALYGLALGLLMATLQFFEYRWMLMSHAEGWYIGLVAVLFAAVGIWAGRHWSASKEAKGKRQAARGKERAANADAQAAEPFRPKTAALERLGITPRELEVLEWMARGLSNQEIAERLFVSLNTVKTHASNVFAKLGAQRRTQAIQQAKELGLLP